MGARLVGFVRWSPDGKRIAFHARLPDEAQVYVVDLDAGVLRRLTSGAAGFAAPAWSRDGQYIYAGQTHVYRVRLEDGHIESLFDGRAAMETPDGKRILYAKALEPGVFMRSLEGDPSKNPEQRIVDDFDRPAAGGFFPVSSGFFYTGFTPQGIPRAFRFFDYAQKKARDIAPAPYHLEMGLTVSPDQSRLLYTASQEASGYDLLMLEFQQH